MIFRDYEMGKPRQIGGGGNKPSATAGGLSLKWFKTVTVEAH